MSTYTPISTVTLASDASEIVFTGLPQTYTDLVIMGSVASADTSLNRGLRIQLNSDTGNNYSRTGMYGETSAVSFRESSTSFIGTVEIPPTTSGWGSIVLNLQNYSNTTTNKTVISKGGAPANQITASVGLWRNTAAITSVRFFTSGSNIRSGSTLTVYGIGAGSPKAFGGDVVTNDGTYWYHAFTSSGVFSPMQNLSCDILVVAGGGGGGEQIGAGGGAGGLLYHTSQAITGGTNNVVTIGAGGTSTQTFGVSNPGSNSQFASLTASIGGGGGAHGNDGTGGVGYNGGSGGSGGGASQNNTSTTYSGGTATSGQGNRGGNATRAGGYANGGGGGAGAAGTDSASTIGVAGGAGVSTYSSLGAATNTGQNVSGTRWFAGGGGSGTGFSTGTAGGAGGNGGGGNGGGGTSSASGSTAGLANTGGGGGGGGQRSGDRGSSGGSGVVIVRYAMV